MLNDLPKLDLSKLGVPGSYCQLNITMGIANNPETGENKVTVTVNSVSQDQTNPIRKSGNQIASFEFSGTAEEIKPAVDSNLGLGQFLQ